jgi:hypothetical protein
MDNLLAQIILAAKNDDIEGWMNILFVVIIAVFWALGGILKAKTKNVKKEVDENLSDKSPRKHEQFPIGEKKDLSKHNFRTRSVGPETNRQYRRQIERLRRRVSPRLVSLSLKTEKKPIAIPSEKTPVKPRTSKQMPEINMPVKEHSKLESKPVGELKDKNTTVPQEMSEVPVTLDSLLDYTNSDELKKAILHYEILGKPMSMREPGDKIIGL